MREQPSSTPEPRISLDLSSHLFSNKYYQPQTLDNPLFRTRKLEDSTIEQSSTGSHIVKQMDKLWNASLYEFIKSQDNCECTARYIAPIMLGYDLRQIVQGLEWMLKGWKPESKARFLRILFADMTPEYAGTIFTQLSIEWDFENDVTMNTALLLMREPALASARFIAEISRKWDPAKIVELIGCMDVILDWPESYFQEFTLHVIDLMCVGQSKDESRSSVLLSQLTLMYEMNLAQTNLKIALADYQLGLNEKQLATIMEHDCVSDRDEK